MGAAGNKRSSSGQPAGSAAKKAKMIELASERIDNKNLSLAPTKKLNVVMKPTDPLVDKLQMLKKVIRLCVFVFAVSWRKIIGVVMNSADMLTN